MTTRAHHRRPDTRCTPEAVRGHAVRVIGAGRTDCGDDAAGALVARALRARLPECIAVVECPGEMYRLIEAWEGAEAVIVVDAVSSGAPPGTVYRLDAQRDPLPPDRSTSTHGFGLAAALELARALGLLPPRVVVYGIEGGDFGLGRPVTPRVHAAIDWVVALAATEASSLNGGRAHEPAA